MDDMLKELLQQLREEIQNNKKRSALETLSILEEVLTMPAPQPQKSQKEEKRLTYSISETAEMLGMHPSTVWKYILQGTINAIRPGKKYLIPASEIEKLLSQNT